MLRMLSLVLTALSICVLPGRGAEAGFRWFSLHPRESWSACFGGVEKVIHVDVTATEASRVRAAWTISVEGRVVERKEQALAPPPAQPATLDISVRLPAVKDGVVMPAVLTVELMEDGKDKPEASWEHPLWIYSQNPFAGREKWLETLKITLFDPEGNTSKILEAA